LALQSEEWSGICSFAEIVLEAADKYYHQVEVEAQLGEEAQTRFNQGEVDLPIHYTRWKKANAQAIREAAKRATSWQELRFAALSQANNLQQPDIDVNGFRRVSHSGYHNLRVTNSLRNWTMPPPSVLGGTLSDADREELTRLGKEPLEDGVFLNLHDVAAHMCSRMQPSNKRSAQEGPRESKAFKALQSDDVPVATTRARSTSRPRERPQEEMPELGPPTDGDTAAGASSTQPCDFAPTDAAEQRNAAAEQNERLQQQMLEAESNMQIVNDRTAALEQLP
jgi:hypothetical protein